MFAKARKNLSQGEHASPIWHTLGFSKVKRPSPMQTPIKLLTYPRVRKGEGPFAKANPSQPKAKVLSPRRRGSMLRHFKFKSHFIFFISRCFLAFPLQKIDPSKSGFSHLFSSLALKKIFPEKRKMIGSSSRAPPPLPNNPEKFITWEAKKLYHESLYSRKFFVERGITNSNVYFNFMI